jgi:hypothetical protein
MLSNYGFPRPNPQFHRPDLIIESNLGGHNSMLLNDKRPHDCRDGIEGHLLGYFSQPADISSRDKIHLEFTEKTYVPVTKHLISNVNLRLLSADTFQPLPNKEHVGFALHFKPHSALLSKSQSASITSSVQLVETPGSIDPSTPVEAPTLDGSITKTEGPSLNHASMSDHAPDSVGVLDLID